MDTKKTKTNKSFWLWITFLFFMFFALALFFPYTGDDWAWGSQIGIDRLNAKFGNYNGRYLGNLLVMLITRNKVLDAAVMSLSYCVMSATPYFLIKKIPKSGHKARTIPVQKEYGIQKQENRRRRKMQGELHNLWKEPSAWLSFHTDSNDSWNHDNEYSHVSLNRMYKP